MYFSNNKNLTLKNNEASNIIASSDTSVVVENNVVDEGRIATDASHGDWPGALNIYGDSNTTVESNTAGYVGVYGDTNSVFKKNDASSDYFTSDTSVDVESNQGAPPALCAPPLPPASRAPPALLTLCRPPQPTTISSFIMTSTSPWKTIQ